MLHADKMREHPGYMPLTYKHFRSSGKCRFRTCWQSAEGLTDQIAPSADCGPFYPLHPGLGKRASQRPPAEDAQSAAAG
jgi:hypothetical protein